MNFVSWKLLHHRHIDSTTTRHEKISQLCCWLEVFIILHVWWWRDIFFVRLFHIFTTENIQSFDSQWIRSNNLTNEIDSIFHAMNLCKYISIVLEWDKFLKYNWKLTYLVRTTIRYEKFFLCLHIQFLLDIIFFSRIFSFSSNFHKISNEYQVN